MANTRQGLGLQALAPGYTFYNGPSQANIQANLAAALDAASARLGRKLGITSGYRSPERNRAVKGAKNSLHMKGLAADIDLTGLSETQRRDVVQSLIDAGAGGLITYTKSPNMLHVDMRPQVNNRPHFMHDKLGARMRNAPGWFQGLANYTPNPSSALSLPSSDIPTPSPRPDLSAAPMLNSAPRPDNVAYTGPAGNFSVNSFGPVGNVQRGPLGPASLPPDRPMPSGPINAPQRPSTPAGPSLSTPGQALAYGQLGGTMAMAGIRNLAGAPLTESLPPDRPMPTGPIAPFNPNRVATMPPQSIPTIAPVAPPTQVAPVYTPPQTIAPMQESSFPAAPPAPARPSVADVYGGMPGTAISNAGIEVSRAPGGFIDRYNPQFDTTTVETPQGYQAATLGKGRLSRTDQARSLLGNKQLSDKAKRSMGTVLGGLLGGAVAGPLGGILGGVMGNRIAGGGVLGGVLGYGANYFPDAPTRPDASWGPGMSDSDLRSYAGDRVADAVKAGRAGLY